MMEVLVSILSWLAGIAVWVVLIILVAFVSGAVKRLKWKKGHKYWSFDEVQRTACPGGTIYDKHSLCRVKATLRLRYYWRCWRCDGKWRTQTEDIPDGGISVFEFNAVHPPRKRDRDV